MLFNSYLFIFAFLPIVLAVYYISTRVFKSQRIPLWLLIISSFVFYGYYNWTYLLILMCSIIMNWVDVYFMRRVDGTKAKIFLISGILFNIALIFYFKYYDFFVENINVIFHKHYYLQNIALPLGISFFTFQQISFVVDSYYGETGDYSMTEYVAFVSFFPQLVAGPIVLHSELVPQFRNERTYRFNWENFARGIFLFSVGLFKKVLLADTFGVAVNWGFGNIEQISGIDAFVVILSYTFQIYFDFSGYCDMASGIASLFNIKLPVNFDSPYQAKSIVEFWDRWHMTLTRFLRAYIYFPLGGSKKGKARTYINVLIVFLISGFWHGASWTFIIWGALHGVASVLYRIFRKSWDRCHVAWQWFMTFLFVSYTWVFFRAESIRDAVKLIWTSINCRDIRISGELIECFTSTETKAIRWIGKHSEFWVYLTDNYYIVGFTMWLWLAVALYLVLNKENAQRMEISYHKRTAIGIMILFIWSVLSLSGVSSFLYFNF